MSFNIVVKGLLFERTKAQLVGVSLRNPLGVDSLSCGQNLEGVSLNILSYTLPYIFQLYCVLANMILVVMVKSCFPFHNHNWNFSSVSYTHGVQLYSFVKVYSNGNSQQNSCSRDFLYGVDVWTIWKTSVRSMLVPSHPS